MLCKLAQTLREKLDSFPKVLGKILNEWQFAILPITFFNVKKIGCVNELFPKCVLQKQHAKTNALLQQIQNPFAHNSKESRSGSRTTACTRISAQEPKISAQEPQIPISRYKHYRGQPTPFIKPWFSGTIRPISRGKKHQQKHQQQTSSSPAVTCFSPTRNWVCDKAQRAEIIRSDLVRDCGPPGCWIIGGMYLTSSKIDGTQYKWHMNQNLFHMF